MKTCCSLIRLALALVAACLGSLPVLAQVAAPPPVRETTDENGVDLVSGIMTAVYRGPAIGPDGSALSFVREFRESGFWDNFGGAIHLGDEIYIFNVTLNGSTEAFLEESPGVFTPYEERGSTLTLSGNTYTYTLKDGTVAEYQASDPAHVYWLGRAYLTTVTYPNGEKSTLTYQPVPVCLTQSCTQTGTATRLVSLINNRGYKVVLTYVAPGGNGYTQSDVAFLPIQVNYVNLTTGATVGSLAISREYLGAGVVRHRLTDALGRMTEYRVLNSFGVTHVRWPGSASDDIVVTYAGTKVSSVNSNGVVTNYGYSSIGNDLLTTVSRAGESPRTLRYLVSGHVLADTNKANQTTSYLYDAEGRLSRVTAPEGNFVEYTYDARGNITQTLVRAKPGSGLADIVTHAGYDLVCSNRKTCDQPNWTEDAKGNRTDYTYDPTHGGVLTMTRPAATAGAVRSQLRYSYSALEAWYQNPSGVLTASGEPIYLLSTMSTCRTLSSCVGTSDEIRMTFGYGASGVPNNRWLVAATTSDGTGTLVAGETTTYDVIGNALTRDGPLAGTADTSRTHFDALRRIVGVVLPDPDGAGSRKPVASRRTYDTPGNLITVETGTVNGQADADWSSFVPLEIVSLAYDPAGRPLRTTLSASGTSYVVEQTSYDALGRPLCGATRMNPATFGSLPASACTLATSGAHGPDRIARNTYDTAGRRTKVTTGSGSGSEIDQVTTTYTSNGLVGTVTDGRGFLTTYEYDGFDRLLKTRFPIPTTAGSSSTTDYEQLGYDANSNVISMRKRNGMVVSVGVDNLNRPVLKDLPGSSAEDVYLSYDNHGRMLAARFGSVSGSGIVNTHDSLGRLASQSTFGRTLSYLYDAAGRRTRITHPDLYYAEYVYNPANELTTITDSTSTTLASFNYDALGRQTAISRGNTTSTAYTYDPVGRLLTLTQNLAGTTFDGSLTFTRAPSGQIATSQQSNDGTYSWTPSGSPAAMTYNGRNQLTQLGATAVSHDALTNLVSGESTFTYGYDVENGLRSAVAGATTVSLSYDPLGMLNDLTMNGVSTKFLYDGPDLIAEYNASGTLLRRYVHGIGSDQPLVWYEGSGTSDRRYFHADERGSVVAVSNNSGVGTVSFKYSPDGGCAIAGSSRFGYTGQAWLNELSLYYYKSRMYSPKVGRFLQPDGIGYAGGMNLYAYVDGDPVNLVDPTGHGPEDGEGGAGGRCTLPPPFCAGGPPDAGGFTDRDAHAVDAHERRKCSEPNRTKAAEKIESLSLGRINTNYERKFLYNFLDHGPNMRLTEKNMTDLGAATAADISKQRDNVRSVGLVGDPRPSSVPGLDLRQLNLTRWKGSEFDGSLGTATGLFRGDKLIAVYDYYNWDSKPVGARGPKNVIGEEVERRIREAGRIAAELCNNPPGFTITGHLPDD